MKSSEFIKEDTSVATTSSSSISAVVSKLGGSQAELRKRQQNYTNQQTKGGPVKIKKSK